jgi:hypothetical protein
MIRGRGSLRLAGGHPEKLWQQDRHEGFFEGLRDPNEADGSSIKVLTCRLEALKFSSVWHT